MIKFKGREQILAERHKTDMERRETTFAFHTERTSGQIGLRFYNALFILFLDITDRFKIGR